MIVILITIASIFMVSIVTVRVFRWITRQTGVEQCFKEGIVVHDGFVEVPAALWMGTTRIPVDNILALNKTTFLDALFNSLLFQYGFGMQWVMIDWCNTAIVIEMKKSSVVMPTLVITTRNAETICSQFRQSSLPKLASSDVS